MLCRGKTNRSGIRFCFGEAQLLDECDGAGELRVEWNGAHARLSLALLVDRCDEVQMWLAHPVKYVRVLRRVIRGRERVFCQLILVATSRTASTPTATSWRRSWPSSATRTEVLTTGKPRVLAPAGHRQARTRPGGQSGSAGKRRRTQLGQVGRRQLGPRGSRRRPQARPAIRTRPALGASSSRLVRGPSRASSAGRQAETSASPRSYGQSICSTSSVGPSSTRPLRWTGRYSPSRSASQVTVRSAGSTIRTSSTLCVA